MWVQVKSLYDRDKVSYRDFAKTNGEGGSQSQ